MDLVGQKSSKTLHVDESCTLFIKLHVPGVKRIDSVAHGIIDQDALFMELESIVGTLEQEILHVEARYKHSLLHESNKATIRTVAKLKRPKVDCRWSMLSADSLTGSHASVSERLARYIAHECQPDQALDLIHYYLDAGAMRQSAIADICCELEQQIHLDALSGEAPPTVQEKPSILISDTSLEEDHTCVTSPTQSDHLSNHLSMPSWPSGTDFSNRQAALRPSTSALVPSDGSCTRLVPSAAPSRNLLIPSKTTTALSAPTTDSARAVWRSIRHASLTTLQRLAESAPEALEQLEAGDEVVKELRRTAVANKRSVGAETLRGWKWEDKREEGVVAPWM
ncbi:hypothetical protein B0A48_04542 [Cryoendolithus antarcticus]|uniref:Uncharacterized protein n=1 Tax=Cryoendolithus antarcticus TaxID=1507870 RepID=A0A1V8TFN8_9PEZI|nr:hypothetical protein B0A48_04542 [Cryoendolithus antarcticus]